MPYAVIEPSGLGIVKGRAKLRLDLFLNEDDLHYDKHYIYVPVFPPEGYPGQVDNEGMPVDQADYDAWEVSLPHVWQNNPFHSHFIYPDKDATDITIKADIERCLNYFYTFHQACWDKDIPFIDEWKKVPKAKGSVRDIFVKGDVKDLTANQTRIANILTRLKEFQIGVSRVPPQDLNIGEKGTIAVGAAAIDRLSANGPGSTLLDNTNPANGTGTIDTVQIYTSDLIEDVSVGIFYLDSGTTYICRDSDRTIGNVNGTPQTITGLSIDVATGDLIGIYWTGGSYLDRTDLGGSSFYYVGERIDPSDSASYTAGTRIFSLYGTGTEAGPTIKPIWVVRNKTISNGIYLRKQMRLGIGP